MSSKTQSNNPLGDLFLNAVQQYPNSIALVTPRGNVSYTLLKDWVTIFVLRIHQYNLTKDSFVVIDIKNDLLAVISILGLTLLGIKWGKFNKFLFDGSGYGATHLLTDKTVKSSRNTININTNWLNKPEQIKGRDININLSGFKYAESIWYIANSSGTTGIPKFMPISAKKYFDRIFTMSEYFTGKPIRICDYFPMGSNIATLNLFTVLATGGTYVFPHSYNELIRWDVEHFVGSPQHFSNLLKNVPIPDVPKIYQARVVGSALSPDLLKKLLLYFKTVRVSYGSTEAGPSTSKELTAYTDDRSVGTCYKGIVVEIVDNDLSLLPNTQEGIIRIKSSNTIEEYLNAPDASLESFSDEWFYPGDRGYFDAEGSLYISGRIKDQLNINGAKINAVLIDEQIQATDGFMDGFCFTQEEEGIMVLSALVTAKSDISIDQTIKEFAKRIIDTHARSAMVPSRIYFVPRVPRNNGGKILRHQGSETVRGLKFINIVTGSNPDTKNENA